MKKKKLTKEGKKQQRKIANLKKKLNSAHGTIDDLNDRNEVLTARLADKKVKTRNDKKAQAQSLIEKSLEWLKEHKIEEVIAAEKETSDLTIPTTIEIPKNEHAQRIGYLRDSASGNGAPVVKAYLTGLNIQKYRDVRKLTSWRTVSTELAEDGVTMAKSTCNEFSKFTDLIDEVGAHKFMYGCGDTKWGSVKKLLTNDVLRTELITMAKERFDEFKCFVIE